MLRQKLMAEFLGSVMLVATVVGSGIMAEQLAEGQMALALLANAIATGAILFVIISIFGPVSGAHFNPVVTTIMLVMRTIKRHEAALYILVQTAGGIAGSWLVHIMFDMPILQFSDHMRSGLPQYFSEIIASFGLMLTILLGLSYNRQAIAPLVALYITAAYWFTASTSFANPAVTIARTFSDSFAGIHYSDVLPFIIAQFIGGFTALWVARLISAERPD